MSDSDSDDDFNEDKSDEETEEERERREVEEEIEECIADIPIVEIGDDTYYRRTVTEIKVREGVTEIEDETFECCINLSSIKLPSTLLPIGGDAFC